MTPTLECVIAVFVIVLIIVLVILTVFVVKFIQEATLTLSSVKQLIDLTNDELKPALKSLNNVLSIISNVSLATNKQIDLIKKILTTLLGASCVAFTNVKSKGGFLSGLISGFNIFRKKGDKKCP